MNKVKVNTERPADDFDYSSLEGLTLKSNVYKDDLIVIGCDPDIGITIAEKHNKKINHICINGPLSPNESIKKWEKIGPKTGEKVYYALFNYLVDCIKEGYFCGHTFIFVKGTAAGDTKLGYSDNGLRCAFR